MLAQQKSTEKYSPGSGGIVLGKVNGKVVRVFPGTNGMAFHGTVFGASGSGKSYGFVIPNIISAAYEDDGEGGAGISMVISDPKGELVAGKYNKKGKKIVYDPGLAGWLTERGYRVLVLNLKNPEQGSHCWNPLQEAKTEGEFRQLSEAMLTSSGKDSPFFSGGEMNLFTALAGFVRYGLKEEYGHMRAAMSIMSWPVESIDMAFNIAYRSKKLPFYFYEKWRAALPMLGHFATGVQSKISLMTDGALSGVLSKSDFELASIGTQKTALFVILPTQGDMRAILSPFYYMLFKRLIETAESNYGRLPIPVRFIMDEFANIGAIPDYEKRISFDRGYGINYIAIMQSLDQFTSLYTGSITKQIMANCDLQLALRVNDPHTAGEFSRKLGTAKVKYYSQSKDISTLSDRFNKNTRRTETIKEIKLMEPHHFRTMPLYTGVALIPTINPIYLDMLPFSEMPEYKQISKEPKKISDFAPEVPRNIAIPPIPEPEDDEGNNKKIKKTKNPDDSSDFNENQKNISEESQKKLDEWGF